MNKLSRILLLILCFGLTIPARAQQQAEMADVMRSNGKIYVVVAVCMTILIGLFIYVWTIDRKISHIEKGEQ
jgi:EamA domain-containing membrane protein RarD